MQIVARAVGQRQHDLQEIACSRRGTLVGASGHVAEIEQRELRREQHAVRARHVCVVREVAADLAQELRAIDDVAAEPPVLVEHVVDRAEVTGLDGLAQVVVEEPDAQPKGLLVMMIVRSTGDHASCVRERRHRVVRTVECPQEAMLDLLQALHLEPGAGLGQHLERFVGQAHEVGAIDLEPFPGHALLVLVVAIEHHLDRPCALRGDITVVAVERLDDDRAELVHARRDLGLRDRGLVVAIRHEPEGFDRIVT